MSLRRPVGHPKSKYTKIRTKVKFDVEYTDTFGGQSNYSWVKRAVISVNYPSKGQSIMVAAKRAMGLTRVYGVKSEYSGIIEFRPHRMATVMFVTFHGCGKDPCNCGEEDNG